MKSIIGWLKNLVPLAVFFRFVKQRSNADDLLPFNLFISGYPGTNKTNGMTLLPTLLNLSARRVHCATIDDVSELVGVPDLRGIREESKLGFIMGELLGADVLVLDEMLDVRPHVKSQLLLFLQRELVLFGKRIPMQTRTVIGTGNLATDLRHGTANELKSSEADRFAMVLEAPSLWDMQRKDMETVITSRSGDDSFLKEFLRAVEDIDRLYQAVERDFSAQIQRYIFSLGTALKGTDFHFEGRRAQLLYQFLAGTWALCLAQPERKLEECILSVVTACLSYHKLSGVQLDMNKLAGAHATAMESMGHGSIEGLISLEPELENKVGLLVRHLDRAGTYTKTAVLDEVLERGSAPLRLACRHLVASSKFAEQPPDLRGLVERAKLPYPQGQVKLTLEDMGRYCDMSQMEVDALQLSGGDGTAAGALLSQTCDILSSWEVPCDDLRLSKLVAGDHAETIKGGDEVVQAASCGQ
jgi:MoxR-like ATPase